MDDIRVQLQSRSLYDFELNYFICEDFLQLFVHVNMVLTLYFIQFLNV